MASFGEPLQQHVILFALVLAVLLGRHLRLQVYELIHLQTEVSAEQNRKDEGKEYDVLLERFAKRSHSQLMGRTPQNKAVVIDKGNHHIGETVRVRITGSSSATLLGEEVVKE